MLPVAGQTAGPIGLNFFVDSGGGGCYRLKKFEICFQHFKFFYFKYILKTIFYFIFSFHGQRRALQLVVNKLHACHNKVRLAYFKQLKNLGKGIKT